MIIARRLMQGCFDHEFLTKSDVCRDLFHESVQHLLCILLKCSTMEPNGEDGQLIFRAALADWRSMYSAFNKEEDAHGLVAAVQTLLRRDKKDCPLEPASMAELLLEESTPWFDRCDHMSCTNDIPLFDTKFKICSQCKTAVHASCWKQPCQNEVCGAVDGAKNAAISKWKLQFPTTPLPDFRGERSKEFKWNMKVIKFKGRQVQVGSFEPFGFQYRDLEDCSEIIDKALSGKCLVTDLEYIVSALAVDNIGLLVTQVDKESMAERSGLLVGDIIVSVDHANFIDAYNLENGRGETNFQRMSRDDRRTALGLPATETKMVIMRPAPAITDDIQKWRRGTLELNAALKQAWREELTLCEDCRERKDLANKDAYRVDLIIRAYENAASLVGKSILILQDDPLLESITRELKGEMLVIEHMDRPVELLIVSFLPELEGPLSPTKVSWPGIFHLLPIVNHQQLLYLGSLCKPRRIMAGCELDKRRLNEWAKDGLLDLPGVTKMRYVDVMQRVFETKLIHDTITQETSNLAGCTTADCLNPANDTDSEKNNQERSKPISSLLDGERDETDAMTQIDNSVENDQSDGCISGTENNIRDMLESRVPALLRMVDGENESSDCDTESGESNPLMNCIVSIQGLGAKKKPVQPLHSSEKFTVLYSDTFVDAHPILGTDSHLPPADGAYEAGEVILQGCSTSWGFELVTWSYEPGRVRVGRVQSGSKAHLAGLTTHSVIMAVNGKPMSHLVDDPDSLKYALFGISLLAPCESIANDRCIVLHVQTPTQRKPKETSKSISHFTVDTSSSRNEIIKRNKSDERHSIGESQPTTDQPRLKLIYPPIVFSSDVLLMYYSDLCAVATTNRQFFSHRHQILELTLPPIQLQAYGPPKEITVFRRASSLSRCGFGWGLELVSWCDDTLHRLRVGRMHTLAEAYTSGLRPNDIVESVNGKTVSEFSSTGELANTILGVEYSQQMSRCEDAVLQLLHSGMRSPAASSVTFVIRQPRCVEPAARSPVNELPSKEFEPPRRIAGMVDLTGLEDDDDTDGAADDCRGARHSVGQNIDFQMQNTLQNPMANIKRMSICLQQRPSLSGARLLSAEDLTIRCPDASFTLAEVRVADDGYKDFLS